eukprot:2546571-Rhodomonas_salina.1
MSECDLCEAGSYQPDRNATRCTPCKPGHYCTEGASAPQPCPAGRRTNPSLAVMKSENDCLVCREGTFCQTGSAEETECAPGTFSNESEASVCSKCGAGTYQQHAGATSCEQCVK